ncbi:MULTISPECIES: Rnf-Nqr domain containing protein [unclassified Pseudomonas]|uniref:Rnf-Nqr domain containing protein n=1 Tax=unclassified Pseudomonas TaxID=196821 RepID=UPI0011EEBCFC|nr:MULTISPECIES: Rnf-Nqr domain containing protein [unclassified Pseudomonas]KAA0946712.1 NADH:quinone oxidoreductase [Pseudomonas sp. ANT_H4]KAA0953187.1 NADH:quinone oxidoreductase [Pseudomonas sp. ANT_H14]
MTDMLLTLVSTALISNFVLQMPLAVDPVLASSADSLKRVHALGVATTVLMLLSGILGYLLDHYLLQPLALTSLRLFIFLPVTVLLIKPLLSVLSHQLPKLSFDGLWPLLLGNAGVLGVVLLGTEDDKGLAHMSALSLGAGLGFWLVLSLFNDLRQRIVSNDIPLPFRGLPVELISAGLMAVAFLGFNAMIKP